MVGIQENTRFQAHARITEKTHRLLRSTKIGLKQSCHPETVIPTGAYLMAGLSPTLLTITTVKKWVLIRHGFCPSATAKETDGLLKTLEGHSFCQCGLKISNLSVCWCIEIPGMSLTVQFGSDMGGSARNHA